MSDKEQSSDAVSIYSEYIHKSRYARWLPEEKRRESWNETVRRYIDYFDNTIGIGNIRGDLESHIINLEVMPSMRSLMTAGKALDRDNVAGFNCSYLAVDSPRAFDETLYILCCGTGVGFSVERQYINKLPEIAEEMEPTDTVIKVADSKIGWARAYRELISLLYSGQVPQWDVSKIRPAGAPLKTFGGRASGPQPLLDLFTFTVEVFTNARGRKLTSIECHDLMCKVADIVVVGGVRRSALISLSNLTDERMRVAKSGNWWEENGQRALANNSVCYTEKPDMGIWMKEWSALYESKSGERGIFNREAAIKTALRNGRREPADFGTNPCSEIILRPKQFCNLSEVVVRSDDTLESLKNKVRLATILGTLQATLTDFRYLSSAWKKNTEEEALLGVSLTGIMDHPFLSELDCDDWLRQLKEVAIETNKEWSDKLGINPATAITCVKPSGTVSQLVNSASGIHPRYSPYYVRTLESGVPVEDDVTKPNSTYIFSFPIKSPENSVYRDDRNAIEQLELWKVYAKYYCEHKPSITVYVKEEEWMEVGAWVYENFDMCSGVSFLPHSNHSYKQAPYQEITEEEYNELLAKMPEEIDWNLSTEEEDMTTAMKELACTANSCEV